MDNGHCSLCHHHLHKLFIVYLAITINVSFPNHLINLLVCELLTQVRHDMPQLCSTDEAIAITVEHVESLNELFLSVCVLHLSCHQREKLWEVNSAVSVCIDFVDHILKFCLCGILAQRPHDRAQLLRGDRAIAILVEERKRLLEIRDL